MIAETIVFIAVLCEISHAEPTVRIEEGDVIGVVSSSRSGRKIYEFRGIPYAEPPVGDLRFRSPVPKKPWDEPLESDSNSADCPQWNLVTGAYMGDEDCLTLNVSTPTLDENAGLPVMIFVHGGGFASTAPFFARPNYFLDRDVILVTFSYRVGALGFMSTGDLECPGNFGLKDQLLVFKWVQRNIKVFGGDNSRVTIFGQGAGGASVNLHALSDSSEGLYSQYIMQSGESIGGWGFRDIKTYSRYSKEVAELYRCPSEDSAVMMECLRELSAVQLVNADTVFGLAESLSFSTWGPTVEPESDDAIITKEPFELLSNNKMKDYPFIIGHVRDEGLLITANLYRYDIFYQLFVLYLDPILTYFLTPYASSDQELGVLVEKIKNEYLDGVDWNDKDDALSRVTKLFSDLFVIYPEKVILSYKSQNAKKDFYLYSFEYYGSYSFTSLFDIENDDEIGVMRGDDLIYLFPLTQNKTKDDLKVVDTMIDLWTSFAISGVPSSKSLENEVWPAYLPDNNYIQIGNNRDPTVRAVKSNSTSSSTSWSNYVNTII